MAHLTLNIANGPLGLEIAGKVFPAGAGSSTPPVAGVLTARTDRGTKFDLDPGSYVYEFHVESGDGTFTVNIDNAITNENCGTDDYDTVDGKNGLDLSFQV